MPKIAFLLPIILLLTCTNASTMEKINEDFKNESKITIAPLKATKKFYAYELFFDSESQSILCATVSDPNPFSSYKDYFIEKWDIATGALSTIKNIFGYFQGIATMGTKIIFSNHHNQIIAYDTQSSLSEKLSFDGSYDTYNDCIRNLFITKSTDNTPQLFVLSRNYMWTFDLKTPATTSIQLFQEKTSETNSFDPYKFYFYGAYKDAACSWDGTQIAICADYNKDIDKDTSREYRIHLFNEDKSGKNKSDNNDFSDKKAGSRSLWKTSAIINIPNKLIGNLRHLRFSPNDKILAAYDNEILYIFDCQKKVCVKSIKICNLVNFKPDSKLSSFIRSFTWVSNSQIVLLIHTNYESSFNRKQIVLYDLDTKNISMLHDTEAYEVEEFIC